MEGEGDVGAEVVETPDAPETPDTDTDTDTKADAAAEKPAGETPPDVIATWSEQEWAKALIEEQETGGEFTITQAEIDALPIDAKRTLAALAFRGKRAQGELDQATSAATTALEEARKREERALLAQAEALKFTESAVLQKFIEDNKPKGEQPDPETPEGVKWLAQKTATDILGGFMDALKATAAERDVAVKTAETTRKQEVRAAEVAAYMAKYPEDFAKEIDERTGKVFFISPVRKEIEELLKETDYKITPERAHQLVRSRHHVEELERVHSEDLNAARQRVVKGGNRGPVIPEMPAHVKGDAEAEYNWYEANPEARKRDIERHRRQRALAR